MSTLAPVNLPAHVKDGRRVWACSVCGREGCWGATWSAHGSFIAFEGGDWDSITIACSEECAKKAPEGTNGPDYDPLTMMERVREAERTVTDEIAARAEAEELAEQWKRLYERLRHAVHVARHYPHESEEARLKTITDAVKELEREVPVQ